MSEFYKPEMLTDSQLLEVFTHVKLEDYPSVTMLEELRQELTNRGYEVEDTIIEVQFRNENGLSHVKMSRNKTLEINLAEKEKNQ